MNKKIGIVIGTRPEAIKLIPVYLEMKERLNSSIEIIATGQHRELVEDLFKEFNIMPSSQLNVMTENQSLSELSSKLHLELGKLFKQSHYELIIVQGDTTTSMIAAVEAFYHKIKVAHVEAGLRTKERLNPFPEEMNRRLISKLADFHFCPTELNKRVLLEERTEGLIEVVGNTVIDSMLRMKTLLTHSAELDSKFQFLDPYKKLVLLTAHRRENFGIGLESIFSSIKQLASENQEIAFIFPAHPNPQVQEKCHILQSEGNIHIIEPLPYRDLIYIMMRSWLVITDSGGIQEEAPSLGLPIIVLREETERQEVIDAGCGVLVGTDSDQIKTWFNKFLTDINVYSTYAQATNPYGSGDSAVKITNTIEMALNN